MGNPSSDLQRLRAAGIPRDEALCQELAARFEPASRYLGYRALWLVVAGVLSFVPALVVVFVITAMTRGLGQPAHATPAWLLPVLFAVWLLVLVSSWLPFGAWLRRRRAQVLDLFRQGRLVDAVAGGQSTMATRGGPVHRVSFRFDDDERSRAFVVNVDADSPWSGQHAPVLCLAGFRSCAVFLGDTMLARRTT